MKNKHPIYCYVVMDFKTQKPIFESATLPIYYSLRTARITRDGWRDSYITRLTHEQILELIKTFGIGIK